MLYWNTDEPEQIVDVGSEHPTRRSAASCSSGWVAQYLDWISPTAEPPARTDSTVAKKRKIVKKKRKAFTRRDTGFRHLGDACRDFDYAEGGFESAQGWDVFEETHQ